MSDKIKICHVVGGLHGGGVEAVIYNHFSHMDLDKFEVHVISNSPSIEECENDFKELGCIIHVLPERRKDFIGNLKQTIHIFKKYKFDVLHVHMNLNCFYHTFLGKICGIPIRIAHAHLVEYPKSPIKKAIDGVKKRLTRWTANRYFACGKSAATYLFGAKNVNQENVYILNNAISVSNFSYDEAMRNKIREELGISDSTLVLGHIGRFTEQKNHDFLIEIFSEVVRKTDDTLLLLFGKGELEDDIKKKVNELGLSDYVKFMGVHNDVYKYYQAMDAFVFPSLYEGLGIVLVEAQTAGLYCYSADTVPPEVKISDLVRFIPLQKKPTYWCEKILMNGMNPNRTGMQKYVERAGYEINLSSKKLQKWYIDSVNNLKGKKK